MSNQGYLQARPDAGNTAEPGDYSGLPNELQDQSSIDIRQILAIIQGNLSLIVFVMAATFAIALVVSLLQTPRYTAVTTVQINDQSSQVLGKDHGGDTDQPEGTTPLDTERFLQTQMDILNSRAIALRVAQRLNLLGQTSFFTVMGTKPPVAGSSDAEMREATLQLLLDNATADLPRNSRLASISFTCTDRTVAANIANAWAEEFIQANLQRRFDSSSYARNFIAGQLNESKARLEKSERDLNAYARRVGLIKTRDATLQADTSGTIPNSVTTQSLLELNSLANQAEQVRINAEQRWKAYAGGSLMGAPEVVNNQTITSLLTEKARTESDLQHERTKHLEDYPTVQQLKARVAALNEQINQVASTVRESVKQQYETAAANERKLKAQVTELKQTSLEEQDRDVDYNLLARDADTNRSVYEGLLQRYKELTAAAGISASNISIIDVATAPVKPSSPKILRNLALSILIGLVLAGSIVALRHNMDDAVKIPEDVESKLELTLLGVIPKTKMASPMQEMADPKSGISESYNSLRSALIYSTSRGLPRTMLVTSSQPAEGKSTTSLAIALGIAKLGRRVVLIDVDMRRPSIHGLLDLPNTTGLSNLLTRQDTIENAIQPSGSENLSVITSGPVPPSPTDLLSTPAMPELLDTLAAHFDLILLDSPPVLGLADAPLLSTLVEGVVMVIQSDRSRRGSLKSSLRRLRAARANILGGVLTIFDPAKTGNRYTEYYGYSYYHYYGTKND